jgi:hypothetical protein
MFVVLALPSAAFLMGWLIFKEMKPIYAGVMGYDYDPAYVFLFNGLNILKGTMPGHIDHPGTPLQVVAGLVTLLRWTVIKGLGFAEAGLVESVLLEPEAYMATVSVFLLSLNCGAVAFLGHRVLSVTGDLRLAVLCQLAPFLFSLALPRMVYLSPEALVFAASFCLLAVLAPSLLRVEQSHSTRTAVITGVICGVATATKITFLPVTAILLLLRPLSRITYAVLAFVASFLISVAPILPLARQTARWYVDLASHTGHYGGGPSGFVDLSLMPARLETLWDIFPAFFICVVTLAALLIAIAIRRPEGVVQPSAVRLPAVVLLVSLVQLVAVLKHYGMHYLVPALPILSIGLAWVAWLEVFTKRSSWRAGLLLVVLCVAGVYAARTSIAELAKFESNRVDRDRQLQALDRVLAGYPGAVIIGSYRVGLQSYARVFGLGYTRDAHAQVAQRTLRHELGYNRWNRKLFHAGKGWLEDDYVDGLVAAGISVLFLAPKDVDVSQFIVERIAEIGGDNLYRVSGATARK